MGIFRASKLASAFCASVAVVAICTAAPAAAEAQPEGKDLEFARIDYAEAVNNAKLQPGQPDYARALRDYTIFLATNNMHQALVPVAGAYYDEYKRVGSVEPVPLHMIALALTDTSEDLANKYFDLIYPYDKQMVTSPVGASYGRVCYDWARMLYKYGKQDAAIKVLRSGLKLCMEADWSAAVERDMLDTINLLEKYMIAINRVPEAAEMRKNYEQVVGDRKQYFSPARGTELDLAINRPGATPLEKIKALNEKARWCFKTHDCEGAAATMERAISYYEANATSPDSALMYRNFSNLKRQFAKCGQPALGKSIAMRLVKARMVYGFEDPASAEPISGCANPNTWPFEELLTYGDPDIKQELLGLARASKNRLNIIYVLSH